MNQVEKAKITKLIQIINWEDTENSIRPMSADFCSIYNEFHSTNAVGTEDERVQQLNEFYAWCNEIADMLSPQQAGILFNELRKNGIFFQDFKITDTASKFVLDFEIGKVGDIVNGQGLVHKVLSNLYQIATQYEPILGLPSKNTAFYQGVSRCMLQDLFCNLHFEQYCTDVWYQSFDCILKEIVRIDHDTARKEIESALERLLTVVDNENDYYAVFEAYYNRLKNRHDNKRIENDDYNIAKMKTINLNELKQLIKEYASSNIIAPLFVFGESHWDGRWEAVRELLGETCWKITFDDDSPRQDIPYCLYNTYFGAECNSTLANCFTIATNIHRPVFCFIDNSVKDEVPQDILSGNTLYELR